MGYPGGKSGAGVYQTIINQIPPHANFASPFAGHCGITQRIRRSGRTVLCDRDPAPLDWWTEYSRSRSAKCGDRDPAAESCGPARLELYNCCGIEWLRHEFGFYRWLPQPPNFAAGAQGDENGDGRPPQNGAPRYRWMVYCDPPYPLETRSSGPIYDHEMTTEQHEELLKTLVFIQEAAPDVAIAISTYPNDLYAEYLRDWHSIDFWAQTRGGSRRRERLVMSYAPPAELHDYRFLGKNKREREKINRRRRNWRRGLELMAPKERNAILEELRFSDFGSQV